MKVQLAHSKAYSWNKYGTKYKNYFLIYIKILLKIDFQKYWKECFKGIVRFGIEKSSMKLI